MFLSAPLVIVTFAAVGTVVSVDTETYKKGGKAVLSPGSVSEPITTVTWKHGADIAVEWYGQETTAYRDFKGRCEVDTTTGALTISNLTLKDSGSYTAEINNRIMKATEIRVITAVPKPTISTRCSPEGTQCTLTCNANITDDMGTITYFWTTGDRQIPESSSNQLNITKDDSEFVEKMISCQLGNPVSSERSDDIMSPFTNGSSVGGIKAAVVIPLLIVLCIVLGLLAHYLIWRRKNHENAGWREYLTNFDPRNCRNRERNRTTQNTSGAVTGPDYHAVPTQDQDRPVPTGTNSEAATSPENQEDSNQDQQGPVPQDDNDEAATNPENQAVTNQHQAEPVLKDTNKEAEMPNNTSERLNDPGSDQTPADPTEPSSETKTSAVAPNAEEPPDQHAQQEDENAED